MMTTLFQHGDTDILDCTEAMEQIEILSIRGPVYEWHVRIPNPALAWVKRPPIKFSVAGMPDCLPSAYLLRSE